jgi:hypothetical protein
MVCVMDLQFYDVPGYSFKVLKSGVHIISEKDFKDLFVTPFPNSTTREEIANQFFNSNK